MPTLKVLSLQHLARTWQGNSDHVRRGLVKLVRNSPTFTYNPLIAATRDLLVLGIPYEQIVKGIARLKREDIRENFLEVLPLIEGHFRGESPDYVQGVARRYYPVGRDLLVPFDPPMIYGTGGQLRFPWFIFWRSNPISAERLSLFVTLVEEVLLQDPDLEDAKFEILDFSLPKGGTKRELTVVDARDIPRLTEVRKAEMLEIYAEGYRLASAELAHAPDDPGKSSKDKERRDPDHPDLFK
jgi:hypothetical protein